MGSEDKIVQNMEKNIQDASDKQSEAKNYSKKVKKKADELKDKLRDDIQLRDDDYMEVLKEVHEYEENLKAAENKMKASQTTFMVAHGTTMEVLGVAGQVQLGEERYNKKGPRKYQCLFCLMTFDTVELRKHHILMYHWNVMDTAVSIIIYL